ncbi:Protein lifeguard 2 (Fas apoptotic inhibitory molecule 2) (Neural membrane protein 35) (Transmembrane BAX inhibitor motif-containing protein 2) [Durusdinium trenchii]|uniref:Protein lifeguard 2 (Fas apoptotic inhibitory molecule 2) (Neural membrane protein 35) (Transmembrane BAX inhibitor motif-containing protein 2) n=2 Tax=Durusdinium trenchii TaxID=1381693 RepID=A0ABP0QW80_9DINO
MEELQGEEQVLVNASIKGAPVAVRKGFVQKVYGILTMQLALTVLIATEIVLLAGASGDVAAWITRHEWLLWVSVFGTFSVMCCMLCCRDLMRRFPTNYIFLFTFTAFEAILIGLVSTMFTPQSLLLAAGVTTLIFLALTVYAMQANTDFTGSAPYLFAGFLALFIFGLILGLLPLMGVPISISTAIYDCLGVLLFSFAIIFDTQLMLGEWGGHKVAVSIDEYVFAALNLYMDIINIFLHVLSLFGERRR